MHSWYRNTVRLTWGLSFELVKIIFAYLICMFFFFLTIMFYVPQIEATCIFSHHYYTIIDIRYIHLFPRSIRNKQKEKFEKNILLLHFFSVILLHTFMWYENYIYLLQLLSDWGFVCVQMSMCAWLCMCVVCAHLCIWLFNKIMGALTF